MPRGGRRSHGNQRWFRKDPISNGIKRAIQLSFGFMSEFGIAGPAAEKLIEEPLIQAAIHDYEKVSTEAHQLEHDSRKRLKQAVARVANQHAPKAQASIPQDSLFPAEQPVQTSAAVNSNGQGHGVRQSMSETTKGPCRYSRRSPTCFPTS